MPNCVKCNKPMDADSWFRAPTGELVHTECYERLQAELAGLNEQQMSDQQKMFEKIRGLLRKAESTTFEQEANTFFAKAQELMLRYRIDEEALWKLDPERRANIDQIFITLRDRDSGVMHKRVILQQVAKLSSCRSWYMPNQNRSVVCGYPNDLIWVDMLFTSIMTQGNFKMAMWQARSESHTKTFRNNFWMGFADKISTRLQDAYNVAQRASGTDVSESMAVALRDRKQRVDDYVNNKIRLGKSRRSSGGTYDPGARAAGSQAAETVDISGGRRNVTSSPKQLGSGS